MEDKFWKNVKKTDDCWIWTGEKQGTRGYGRITSMKNGVRIRKYAHRFSYELAYGVFDQSLYVCHKCDNPICVRPDHLFIGTHTDNMRDMCRKNRRSLKSIERKFSFVNPSGDIVSGQNISRFCIENGLHRRYMQLVLDGRLRAYKGWAKYQE